MTICRLSMGVQGAKPLARGAGERCLGDSVKGPPKISPFYTFGNGGAGGEAPCRGSGGTLSGGQCEGAPENLPFLYIRKWGCRGRSPLPGERGCPPKISPF